MPPDGVIGGGPAGGSVEAEERLHVGGGLALGDRVHGHLVVLLALVH